MDDGRSILRFVRESLPLLASYIYSEQVILSPADIHIGTGTDDEYEKFASLLRMRHAIACGLALKPIYEAIKRSYSQSSEVARSESKGIISGRLDIPLYLNRRGRNLSWPKSFPILVVQGNADTPENQLVVHVLRQLIRRLNEAGHLDASAERIYCLNLLRWGREQLHTEPWNELNPTRYPDQLYRESLHRLRKRQTGNEAAYRQLLGWYRQWIFDAGQSDPEELENFLTLLMAFPAGDFFSDRVFEIWCLQQVIESFRRNGAVLLEGPNLLSARSGRSICTLRYEGYRFEIWFQRALPAAAARWHYIHSRKPLGGIPDITVSGDDGRYLFFDAKRREVRSQTRPEETYKMLGYLENFRGLFEKSSFWGALCFLSDSDLYTEVMAENGHRVVLLGAHLNDPQICAFGGRVDTLIAEWLSQRRENEFFGTAATTAPLM